MKKYLLTLMAFGIFGITSTIYGDEIHRFYQPSSGDHLLTINHQEIVNLPKYGWHDEGAFGETVEDGIALYRLYNPNSGEHLLTLSSIEKTNLLIAGWYDEGRGFKVSAAKGQPVFRLFNPNSHKADSHHFTANLVEVNQLVKIGWRNEGVAFYQNPVGTKNEIPADEVTPVTDHPVFDSNSQPITTINSGTNLDNSHLVKVVIVHVDELGQRLKDVADTTLYVQPNQQMKLDAEEIPNYRAVDDTYRAAFATDTVIYFTYEPLLMDRKLDFRYFDVSSNQFIDNPIDITGQPAPTEVPEPTYNLFEKHPILKNYLYINFDADTYLAGPKRPVYRFINNRAEVVLNYAKVKNIAIQYIDYETKKVLSEERKNVAIGRDVSSFVTKNDYLIIDNKTLNPELYEEVTNNTQTIRIFVNQTHPFVFRYYDKQTGKLVSQSEKIDAFNTELGVKRGLRLSNYRIEKINDAILKDEIGYVDVVVVPNTTKVTFEYYESEKIISKKVVDILGESIMPEVYNQAPKNFGIDGYSGDTVLEGNDVTIKVYGQLYHPITVHYIDSSTNQVIESKKLSISSSSYSQIYYNYKVVDKKNYTWNELKEMDELSVYVMKEKTQILKYVDEGGQLIKTAYIDHVYENALIDVKRELPRGYSLSDNQSTFIKYTESVKEVKIKANPVITLKFIDESDHLIKEVSLNDRPVGGIYYLKSYLPTDWLLVNNSINNHTVDKAETLNIVCRQKKIYEIPTYTVDLFDNKISASANIYFDEQLSNNEVFKKEGFVILNTINTVENLKAIYYVNAVNLQKYIDSLDYSDVNKKLAEKYPNTSFEYGDTKNSTGYSFRFEFSSDQLATSNITDLINNRIFEYLLNNHEWNYYNLVGNQKVIYNLVVSYFYGSYDITLYSQTMTNNMDN